MFPRIIKFKFGSVFGILFFSMVALLFSSGIYLVNNGAVVINKAKEQRALMNRQQEIIDDLLFTATQLQSMMTAGLLSNDHNFKLRQIENYESTMLLNNRRVDTLQTLQHGAEQQAAFDIMLAAANPAKPLPITLIFFVTRQR